LKAIGYCVERKRGISFAEQQKIFTQFCNDEGFEPSAIFFDYSTNTNENPGFNQLIDFLKINDLSFLVVVVAENKILGNDTAEILLKITQIELEGKKIILAKNGKAAMNELISVDYSAKPKQQPTRSQRLRYGYKLGARKRFQVKNHESNIIKITYKLYLEKNLGMHSIAKHLNSLNKAGELRIWDKRKVRNILTEQIYTGNEEGLGIPQIISKQDFLKAQKKLKARSGEKRPTQRYPYKLSGLIYCGQCGGKFIGSSRRQKWSLKNGEDHENQYHKYICSNKVKGQGCQAASIHEARLIEEIQTILQEGRAQARLIDTNDYGKWEERMHQKIAQLESQRLKNRAKMKNLIKQAVTEKIKLHKFQELAKEHTEIENFFKNTALETKQVLSKSKNTQTQTQELQDLRAELANNWEKLSEREIQNLLNKTIESIIIHDENVQVFFRA
jgi:hypothetical protein